MSRNDLPIIDKERTGNKIKMLMQQKHMSTIQLQCELGMASAILVYKWLNGTHIPSTERLLQLATIFNCKIEDILVISED